MTALFPFIVAGVVSGSIYAIAGTGLVLTYRTTGLFNLAHGAVSMVVAYAYYQCRVEWGWPTPLAIVVCLLVVAPAVGVAIDRLLFRDLQQASQASKIVVTIGLLVLSTGLVQIVWGTAPKSVPPFLPQSTIDLGDVFLGYDQLAVVVIGLVVLGSLLVFFRTSRLGVAMRAMVDNRGLIESAGFSADRVSMATWALGTMMAGLAGILLVPIIGLDSILLVLLVVKAYGAAVFGRLTNLPITYAAAVALGVVESLSLKVFQHFPTLVNGIRPSIAFIALFAYLVVVKRGRLRELGVSAPWEGSVRARDVSARTQVVLAAVLVAACMTFSHSRLFVLGSALVLSCIFISLNLLIGLSGQINLGHAALVGSGAFVYLHAIKDWSLPFPVALLVAGLAVVPLGLLIAVPALRLPSLFLALATFGFGLLVDGLLFTWVPFSGSEDGIIANRPSVLASDRTYVLLLIAMLGGFVWIVRAIRSSALGRTLVALRDSPTATETLGVDQLWPRFAVFAASAAMAGVAGGLYAGLLEAASKSYFNTFTSLTWVAVVVVGGVQTPAGAILAAFLSVWAPELIGDRPDLLELVTPMFGLGAIVMARRPGGMIEQLRSVRLRNLVMIRPTTAVEASAGG